MAASYEQMYGLPDGEYFSAPGGYQPIIDSIGTVVVQKDDNDYQGDSFILYRDGEDHFGRLRFGWGSCSGCDALQACNSPKEVEELAESLAAETVWGSREEILAYFRQHDWEGDYSSRSAACKAWVKDSIEYLEFTP